MFGHPSSSELHNYPRLKNAAGGGHLQMAAFHSGISQMAQRPPTHVVDIWQVWMRQKHSVALSQAETA